MAKSISIMMGSPRDFPVMAPATHILDELEIPYEVCVSSAHKTPERTRRYVEQLWQREVGVVICGAGAAAHLAGVVAADYPGPVVAVPVSATELKGVDAMLAMVQMPSGVPVATVALDEAGSENAALFAAQCLGICDPDVRARVEAFRARRNQDSPTSAPVRSEPNPHARAALLGAEDTDLVLLQRSGKILEELGVDHKYFQVHPLRNPERLRALLADLKAGGCAVIICASGSAASLAASVSAQFPGPVIGVPVASTPLAGIDALLASIQTPAGIPVGTVAIGPMGAKNAGILAAQVLAGGDPSLSARLAVFRKQVASTLIAEADALMETFPPEHRALFSPSTE